MHLSNWSVASARLLAAAIFVPPCLFFAIQGLMAVARGGFDAGSWWVLGLSLVATLLFPYLAATATLGLTLGDPVIASTVLGRRTLPLARARFVLSADRAQASRVTHLFLEVRDGEKTAARVKIQPSQVDTIEAYLGGRGKSLES